MVLDKLKKNKSVKEFKRKATIGVAAILTVLMTTTQPVLGQSGFFCDVDIIGDLVGALLGMVVAGGVIAAIGFTVADLFTTGGDDNSDKRNKALILAAGVPIIVIVFQEFANQILEIDISGCVPIS